MTHTERTPASPKRPLPRAASIADEDVDERSRRAREEAMAVRPLGDALYEVESESDNTYLVSLEAGRCTCPDHVIRGERCKHLRRVAMEITAGLVPPPGQRAVPCRVCGESTFVDADDEGPHYCETHRLAPGDRVTDAESGADLVVVAVSDRRADAVTLPATGDTVAAYRNNAAYPDDDPVVAAVYPSVRIEADGATPDDLHVYLFPRSRLAVADAESWDTDRESRPSDDEGVPAAETDDLLTAGSR